MRVFQISPEESAHALVLEDDQFERIDWFRRELPKATIVRNPLISIEALKGRDFDFVFLDCDVPCPENLNGIHAARHLAETRFPGEVVVHSANAGGAFLIGKILGLAGIRTTIAEFGS